MALERVPADIRANGGVARMSDPKMIKEIMEAVTIPVMAKARIGHFVECQVRSFTAPISKLPSYPERCPQPLLSNSPQIHISVSLSRKTDTAPQILEALGVDYIDESEVLTPADAVHHIDKKPFKSPFVCGCRNLGEALRRINEGAAMIRTKGEAGTGDVIEAVRHMRTVTEDIAALAGSSDEQLEAAAKEMRVPVSLVKETVKLGRLPVVNFAAGGIATPADAALMMQLGCDGVFVGSGIFKSGNAAKRAKAIVQAVTHYKDPKVLMEVSMDLGEAMVGINCGTMGEEEKLAKRGW